MIKKIILTFTLFCLIMSCGKKGDPAYSDTKKKVTIQSILINNV